MEEQKKLNKLLEKHRLTTFKDLDRLYPYTEEAVSGLRLFKKVPKEDRHLAVKYFAKVIKVCGFLYKTIHGDSILNLRKSLVVESRLPCKLKENFLEVLWEASKIKGKFLVPLNEKHFRGLLISLISSWDNEIPTKQETANLDKILVCALQSEIKDREVRGLLIQLIIGEQDDRGEMLLLLRESYEIKNKVSRKDLSDIELKRVREVELERAKEVPKKLGCEIKLEENNLREAVLFQNSSAYSAVMDYLTIKLACKEESKFWIF